MLNLGANSFTARQPHPDVQLGIVVKFVLEFLRQPLNSVEQTARSYKPPIPGGKKRREISRYVNHDHRDIIPDTISPFHICELGLIMHRTLCFTRNTSYD